MSKFDPDAYLLDEGEDFNPDDYLAEEGEDYSLESDVSSLETMARGGLQGLTIGTSDEIGAALAALSEKLGQEWQEGVDEDALADELKKIEERRGYKSDKPLKQEEFKELEADKYSDIYRNYRDVTRQANKEAQEANKGLYLASEIAGGIIPAIASGGASAAGSVGKELVKKGLSNKLLKESGKAALVGAGYGAASGAGYSESDLTKGQVGDFAKDVAIGTGVGGALGAVTPAGIKGAGYLGGKTKQAAGKLVERFTPSLKVGFKFGEKYGLANDKKINNLIEDHTRELIDTISKSFQVLGVQKRAAEKRAREMAVKYDLSDDISKIADDFRATAKGLAPEDAKQSEKMASKIEEHFLRYDKQREKLLKQLNDDIEKRILKADNTKNTAITQGEEKAVLQAEKSGSELEQIADIDGKKFEDVADLPYDTKGGEISGVRATFLDDLVDEYGNPLKEKYTKVYAKGTTPFKSSPISIRQEGGELVGTYKNEATGEVFRRKVPVSEYSDVDFSNIELEELLELLPVYGNKAFNEGGANQELYKNLYKMLRNKLPEISSDLPKNKRDMVKLYETMEILGISKDQLSNLKTPDVAKLAKSLPSKMDVEKDVIERNLIKPDSPVGGVMEELSFLSDAKKILSKDAGGISETTRAGVLQKGLAGVGDVAGATYGAVSKPIKSVANSINKMSDEALDAMSKRMINSNSEGLKLMGRQLESAIQQEGPIKSAMLWSLSQNPAFRKQAEFGSRGLEESTGFREPQGEAAVTQMADGAVDYKELWKKSKSYKDIIRGQQVLGVDADAKIGPKTIKALDAYEGDLESEIKKMEGEYKEATPLRAKMYSNIADEFDNLTKEDVALIAGLESRHGLLRDALNSSAKGEFQFIDSTANELMQSLGMDSETTDKYSLDTQEKLMKKLLSRNIKAAKEAVDNPDVYDIYTIHLLGSGLGPRVLAAGDDELISDYVSEEAVEGNKALLKDKTIKEFKEAIKKKLNSYKAFEFPTVEPSAIEEPVEGEVQSPLDLSSLENALERYQKYRGSGGEALYSSAGDRLMGEIDNLPVDEYEKEGLKDAVAEGDLEYLRNQLEEAKQYMT